MKNVVWSDFAQNQYLSALAYLADRNEPAAAKFAERVRATLSSLANRPIGRPGKAEDTFEKIVPKTSYLVVYELAGDELRVLRLFHMSQGWQGWGEEKPEAQ
ncbi:hypothetical protein BH09PSE1_BH09PSE1_24070 [soil metagenome]